MPKLIVTPGLRYLTRRRRTVRWDRDWIWGYRSGEWWVGARRNVECDAVEWCLFGWTLIVGRR